MSKRTFTDIDNKSSKKTKKEYIIYNYRESYNDLSSAEYIKKTDNILHMNYTHGLGSGIYGLINPNNNITRDDSYIIEKKILYKPVILDKDEEQTRFTFLSRYLIELCESRINKNKDKYNELKAQLSTFNKEKEEICPKAKSIGFIVRKFVNDYNKANIGDFLKQPINYLLEGPYDGIYNNCPAGDIFSRGSVKFEDVLPRYQGSNIHVSRGITPFLEDGKSLIQIAGKKVKKKKKTKKKKKKKVITK
jgi:hypothetical protein